MKEALRETILSMHAEAPADKFAIGISELAYLAGISQATAREWIQEGLAFKQVGDMKVFEDDEVIQFVVDRFIQRWAHRFLTMQSTSKKITDRTAKMVGSSEEMRVHSDLTEGYVFKNE